MDRSRARSDRLIIYVSHSLTLLVDKQTCGEVTTRQHIRYHAEYGVWEIFA